MDNSSLILLAFKSSRLGISQTLDVGRQFLDRDPLVHYLMICRETATLYGEVGRLSDNYSSAGLYARGLASGQVSVPADYEVGSFYSGDNSGKTADTRDELRPLWANATEITGSFTDTNVDLYTFGDNLDQVVADCVDQLPSHQSFALGLFEAIYNSSELLTLASKANFPTVLDGYQNFDRTGAMLTQTTPKFAH